MISLELDDYMNILILFRTRPFGSIVAIGPNSAICVGALVQDHGIFGFVSTGAAGLDLAPISSGASLAMCIDRGLSQPHIEVCPLRLINNKSY